MKISKPTKTELICYYISCGFLSTQQNLLQFAFEYNHPNDTTNRKRNSNNCYFAKTKSSRSCCGTKYSLCLNGYIQIIGRSRKGFIYDLTAKGQEVADLTKTKYFT